MTIIASAGRPAVVNLGKQKCAMPDFGDVAARLQQVQSKHSTPHFCAASMTYPLIRAKLMQNARSSPVKATGQHPSSHSSRTGQLRRW